MLKAIFTFIISLADTLTMTMLSINHLARAAVERTVVVEKKSVAAAALSEMESINTLALRLQDIQSDANGISPESFDKLRPSLQPTKLRESRKWHPYLVMLREQVLSLLLRDKHRHRLVNN